MKKRILALLLTVSIVVGNGEFVYAVESGSGNTGTEQESTVESKDEDTSENNFAEITNDTENEEKETEPEESEPVEEQSTENPQSADENVDKSNEFSGKCGENAQWTYDQETKELRISGSGAMSDYESNEDVPWKMWKRELESIVVEEGISTIGKNAFCNCVELTEVSIPETMEKIETYAFYYCTKLIQVVIPDNVESIGNEVFYACSNLKEVVLGKKLRTMGYSAFRYCDNLTEVTVLGNVENFSDTDFAYTAVKELKIGKEVVTLKADFYNMTTLEKIEVNKENKVYMSQDGVLYNKERSELIRYPQEKTDEVYQIPEGVEKVKNAAFRYAHVKEITLPESLIEIEEKAFYYCQNLSKIVFPDNVKSIGYEAFYSCSNLNETILGKGLENLKNDVFYNCNKLEKLTVNGTVKELGNYAFACTSIKELRIGKEATNVKEEFYSQDTLEKIEVEAGSKSYASQNGVLYNKEKTELIRYPRSKADVTEYEVPDGVKQIRKEAFFYNGTIESVKLSDSVKSLGEDTFCACSNLKEVTLGKGLESIENYVFYNCNKLEKLTVNGTVKEIGEGAFASTSIKELQIGKEVTNVKEEFYSRNTLEKIEVEAGSKSYASQDGVLYNKEKTELIRYPQSKADVTEYKIPTGVKQIRKNAFYFNGKIEKVTLPDSTQRIGEYAFYGCDNLKEMILGKGLESIEKSVFSNCRKLEKLTVNGTVKDLGDYVFASTSIKELQIGKEVTNVKEEFYSRNTLEKIEVEAGSKSYASQDGVLYNKEKTELIRYPQSKADVTEYKIPTGVKQIRKNAFYFNGKIEKVTLPDSTQRIGEYAFYGCDNLKEMILGKGLESIEKSVFSNCRKLEKLTVNGTVKDLGDYVFASTSIKELQIGKEVTNVKEEFYSRNTLEKIEVEAGSKSYASQDGVLYNKEKTELIRYPQSKADATEYEVPDGVEKLRENAFCYNESIEKVTLPDSVQSIGEYAFGRCRNLQDIRIADGLNSIGRRAFGYCEKMKKIQLPDSLEKIMDYAFEGCSNLTIYCSANSKAAIYAENQNIPYITSTHCITYDLQKSCSVLSGYEKVIEQDAIQNYQVRLYNKTTKKELENYHINGGNIVLNTGTVNENDTLTLTLTSKKDETIEYKSDIILDDKCSAKISILVQQKGCVLTTPQTSTDTTVLVYDSQGQLCDTMESSGEECTSKYLEKGTYNIIYIQGKRSMWKFQSIKEFKENSMLKEGRDYLLKTVTVTDGQITDTGTVSVPDIDIEQLRYLDSSKCSFDTNVNAISSGGLITVRGSYEFKDYRKNEVNVDHLEIEIPDGCNYISDSLRIDGKSVANVREENEIVRVPLDKKNGVFTYNIKPIEYGTISTSAKINFTASGEYRKEQIGVADVEVPYVTLSAPSATSEKNITVSGLTVPNTTVGIYDGDHRIGTAVSSKSGKWNKNVTLYGTSEDSVHNIQAKIYIGTAKEQKSEVVSVAYSPKAISIEQFIMYYNNSNKVDLTDIAYKAKPVISFNPAYPFTFSVRLSNNEDVDYVYIVSTKNGTQKSMKASYDTNSGNWIATGYFDNNHSYVPGVLSVEFKGKKNNYVVQFNQESEETPEELPDKIKNGSYNITENTYDKQTDTGFYGGEVTLADEDKTKIEFNVSKEQVNPDDYKVDTLKKDGYLKVETDDDSSTYYTKSYCNKDGEYVTETIQFEKKYYDDPKLGKTFGEVAKSKLVSHVKSSLIKESEGALPGIGLASKIWNTSKNVIAIGGRLYNLDDAKNRLLKMKLPADEFDKRYNALMALESSYWMYMVGRSIIKGAQIYTSIQFPLVGPIVNFALGFATSYFYSYLDDWYDEQLRMILDCDLRWAVDPSGYVYEAVESNRLQGVKATIYYQGEDGKEVEWDAGEYEQNNPLITNSDGEYAWDVPEGMWRVKFEKDGYQTVYSDWMPVPPIQTGINIAMISTVNPKVTECELYEDYAKVSFDKYMKVDTVSTDTFTVKKTDGTVAKGKVEAVDEDNTTGVALAKEFRITFDEKLRGGNYEIEINKNVKSYADTNLAENYSNKMIIQQEVEDITADVPKNIVMNQDDIKISVKIITAGTAENYEITGTSSVEDFMEITRIENPDKEGNAIVHVKTKLPGTAILTLGIKGQSVQKEIEINIQQFASEAEYIKGDVNEDENVDIQDLRLILRYVCGKQEFLAKQIIIADVNEDQSVDVQDLRKMLRFVCGKEAVL